ncbi:hypothetical protein BCR43DRAFT_527101 [Syncephalastrum racemosum]|uniref:Uncharacterized protein n=1 Tax=Syncephalastrum racemosum TaxID=13706 RepID=A0A1X2H5A6_SYNRA|nr:hypothetical protein BCR43DRAFT_527101 [Syncephalastrum racemosum]
MPTYNMYRKRQDEDETALRKAEAELQHDEETDYANDSTRPMMPLTEDERARLQKHEEDKKKAQKKFNIRRLWSLLAVFVIDIGMPLGLYYGLKNVLPDVYALLISGIPPLIYVIVKFVYKRKVDMLGVLIVIAFIVSGVVSIVSGDARAALLRDSATTAVIALLFGITLIPVRTPWLDIRPLTFLIGHQINEEAPPIEWVDENGVRHEMNPMDWMWDVVRGPTRKFHYLLTGGWSFFLFAEFIIRVCLVELSALSVSAIFLTGTIITVVVIVIMSTGSIIGSIYLKRVGDRWMKVNNYAQKFSSVPAQY